MDFSDKAGEAFERFIERIRAAEKEAGLIQEEGNQEVDLEPHDTPSTTESSPQPATTESDECREREIARTPAPEEADSDTEPSATIETASLSVEADGEELPPEGPPQGYSQPDAEESPVENESENHRDLELTQNADVRPDEETQKPEEGKGKLFNYDRIAIFRKK